MGVAGIRRGAGRLFSGFRPSNSRVLPIPSAIIRRIPSRNWRLCQPGPAGTNVLYGKGLVVKVKAAGHRPKEVFLTALPPGHPEQAITLPMFDKGGAGYDQLLDNVRTDLVVFAHTKDRVSQSKQVRIGVVLTPQLEKAFVRVAPPAYTGLKAGGETVCLQGRAGARRQRSAVPVCNPTVRCAKGGWKSPPATSRRRRCP